MLSLSSLAYAGAWVMPEGKGQTISTTVKNTAHRGYDDQWKLSQEADFSKFETAFYWEHGLTPKLTLIGTTAWQDVDFLSRDGRKEVQGFGTSSLGLRYQIYNQGRTVAALQSQFVLAGEGEIVPDADLGRGGNGIEIRALVGRSFKVLGREGFFDGQSAWIYRGGSSPDSYKVDATIGVTATKKIQLLGQVFYSATGEQTLGIDRVLPNESLKLQGSVVRRRSAKTSVQAGIFRTVAGRNIVKETGFIASVWRRY
ncbi:MAG: hypothetical protein ACSHXY_06645 [Alphaproteobacteria bacterium]